MANQARKRRGRETEHIVTARLRKIWENAYVVNSGASGSDVLGLKFFVEIKARKDFKPKEVLDSIQKRTEGKQLGFAVMRLNGQGEASVDDFAAVIRFGDLITLLESHYPSAVEGIDRCRGCGDWAVVGRACRTCINLDKRKQ